MLLRNWATFRSSDDAMSSGSNEQCAVRLIFVHIHIYRYLEVDGLLVPAVVRVNWYLF